MVRETIEQKAARLLTAGSVQVRWVTPGHALVVVKGDSGTWRVIYRRAAGAARVRPGSAARTWPRPSWWSADPPTSRRRRPDSEPHLSKLWRQGRPVTAKLHSARARGLGEILTAGEVKAPSTVYEEIRRMPLIVALLKAGAIDGNLRDRETGRKVGTILRELARLNWGDLASDDQAAHFLNQYREIRDLPIPEIKTIVRIANDPPGRIGAVEETRSI